MTHTHTQLMMSFVGGLMLGVACFNLLPHAILAMGLEVNGDGIDRAVWWLMMGLLFMFILLRVFHFHQHDQDHDVDSIHKDGSHHEHADHSHKRDNTAHSLSWTGIALGLSLHSLVDGVALGAAIQADAVRQVGAGLFSLGVFAAIVLHKPLDAMSIGSLMIVSGVTSRARMAVTILFALMCPLGALLFFWGIGRVAGDESRILGCALAFSAGAFLCISLNDLLPEVQFHSHDRGKLTLALLLGVALAYSIGMLDPEGADHNHSSNVEGPVPQRGGYVVNAAAYPYPRDLMSFHSAPKPLLAARC
jgi:zinc and cadmium transporter